MASSPAEKNVWIRCLASWAVGEGTSLEVITPGGINDLKDMACHLTGCWAENRATNLSFLSEEVCWALSEYIILNWRNSNGSWNCLPRPVKWINAYREVTEKIRWTSTSRNIPLHSWKMINPIIRWFAIKENSCFLKKLKIGMFLFQKYAYVIWNWNLM